MKVSTEWEKKTLRIAHTGEGWERSPEEMLNEQ